MTNEKFMAFIEKLLAKTKDKSIMWRRYIPEPDYEYWASPTKSFLCYVGSMEVRMLSNEDSDKIEFDIIYDRNVPMVILTPDTDETMEVALRLINYVYDQFPNFEKSIDQFLMEP